MRKLQELGHGKYLAMMHEFARNWHELVWAIHELACAFLSLHELFWACLSFHELAWASLSLLELSWACMSPREIGRSVTDLLTYMRSLLFDALRCEEILRWPWPSKDWILIRDPIENFDKNTNSVSLNRISAISGRGHSILSTFTIATAFRVKYSWFALQLLWAN